LGGGLQKVVEKATNSRTLRKNGPLEKNNVKSPKRNQKGKGWGGNREWCERRKTITVVNV